MNRPGLYRGYVINNDDSDLDQPYLGRLQVHVPEVYGEVEDTSLLPWAWPCIPAFGGGLTKPDENGEGGGRSNVVLALPPIGATVWIMFEQGDIQVPVWMGTWFGKQTEMPSEAKTYDDLQGRSGAYPEIFLIKTPWSDTAMIRIVGNDVVQIRLQDMWIQLKGETEEGEEDQEIEISATTANITLHTSTGKITLSAKELDILSEDSMKIQTGVYTTDSEGRQVVAIEGTLEVVATKDSTFHTEEKGVIRAGEEGGVFLRAPNASGFEKHGGSL